MKKVSDLFVKNFKKSLVILSKLVAEYQAESKIRANRKDKKNEYDLNSSEKEEKETIMKSCNLNNLQSDNQKLIIGEFANCLNKFIDEMFKTELKKIYDFYINTWIPIINY